MREIGLMLQEARIAHHLELGDVAQRTHISGHYLKAIEEGKFHVLPKVFDRGYLKLYAKLLDMDARPILELFDQMQNRNNGHGVSSRV